MFSRFSQLSPLSNATLPWFRAVLSAAAFVSFQMWLAPEVVQAQFGPVVPGLTATATESVAVSPQYLRLVMKVQASGKDSKTAIKALNDHKESVRKSLVEMNAKVESIRFSATGIEDGMNRNVMNMVRSMRMRGGPFGGSEDEEEESPQLQINTASCMVTSQWALPAAEGDALALLPAMLRQQIAARDLEGKKLKPELEDEQMELFEQMAKAMQQQLSYGGEEAGAIRIEYVAQVTDDTSRQTLAKAFESAKSRAKMLSAAAGVALGKLHTVTSSDSTPERMQYSVYARSMGEGLSDDFLGDQAHLVASPTVDGLKHTASVWLTFSLE